VSDVVLDIRGVRKDYRGLRPLRIERLTLAKGQSLALLGFDAITAEVLVNLITGATVPDTGEIALFGQLTTAITDGDAWLASLDRVGILSERAVLLDQMTVVQNLAVPHTLQLNPVPPEVGAIVSHLAMEVGIAAADFERPVGEVGSGIRARVRLGRALALDPGLLVAEHPNATIEVEAAPAFASDVRRICEQRGCAALTFTADSEFASAVASQVLTLRAASGELQPIASGWRRWF
jgi:ABC-type transporter Mla maintaining outer membrane lipid asymmetry ATPase subunit MlaF